MNVLERLFKRAPPNTDPARVRYLRALGEHNGPFFPRLDQYASQADEYRRSAWVYVSVTRIAEAAALVPFSVYQLSGEQRAPVANHPIEKLLRAPNPFMSQFELFEATYGALELCGNAYWFLSGGGIGEGAPVEIWPLRPDRVRIAADPDRFIAGYVYSVGGVEVPLKREEVIHFKRWHPGADLYGLSALEAAALASATDRGMSEYNRKFFGAERAIPAGVVTLRELVSDADFERIQREFLETYSGTSRRTAFIRGARGGIEWQPLGLSQQEMSFIEGRRLSQEEIFTVFGLPLGMVRESATEASAKIAEKVFREQTLWPKLVRVAQKLTQELTPFYGPDLVIEPEETRDLDPDLAAIQAAQGYLTVNEVRARYWKLPPIAWGEQSVTINNSAPQL